MCTSHPSSRATPGALGSGLSPILLVPARTIVKPGSNGRTYGYHCLVFFFFSNRLGCLGSLMLSLVVTALIVLLLSAR